MREICFTGEALLRVTDAQREALYRMLNRNKSIEKIVVRLGSFDLPNGYLMFFDGLVDGGISPEGSVST